MSGADFMGSGSVDRLRGGWVKCGARHRDGGVAWSRHRSSTHSVPGSPWDQASLLVSGTVLTMATRSGVRLTDDEANAMAEYLWAIGSRLRGDRGERESAGP